MIKSNFKIKILLLVVLLFYCWIATGDEQRFALETNHGGHYNDLTDAFLAGQLHFLVRPEPGLLSLPDPYAPTENWRYKYHDASYYKGKYYLYYGPTPIILLYIPYKLITGLGTPYPLAVLIFSFGAFIWSVLLLIHLQKLYFKDSPEWTILFSLLVLAFANVFPYNLRRNEMYQVAISCGSFFLVGGIFLLCLIIARKKPSLWLSSVASLFLGLASGARALIIPIGMILLVLTCFKKYMDEKGQDQKSKFCLFLSLLLPFIFCVLSLLIYNYLRFDNPFEFGLKYSLSVTNMIKTNFFSLQNILPNLYFYLLHPPIIDSSFPFLHVNDTKPQFIQYPAIYYFEKTIGIFAGIPFLILSFLSPFIYLAQNRMDIKSLRQKGLIFKTMELWFLLLPGSISLFVILLVHGVTMRYIADFATNFILVSSVIWLYFNSKLTKWNFGKYFLTIFAVVSGLVSILIGIAAGIEGCCGGLLYDSPEQFRTLESFFHPLANILFQFKL